MKKVEFKRNDPNLTISNTGSESDTYSEYFLLDITSKTQVIPIQDLIFSSYLMTVRNGAFSLWNSLVRVKKHERERSL